MKLERAVTQAPPHHAARRKQRRAGEGRADDLRRSNSVDRHFVRPKANVPALQRAGSGVAERESVHTSTSIRRKILHPLRASSHQHNPCPPVVQPPGVEAWAATATTNGMATRPAAFYLCVCWCFASQHDLASPAIFQRCPKSRPRLLRLVCDSKHAVYSRRKGRAASQTQTQHTPVVTSAFWGLVLALSRHRCLSSAQSPRSVPAVPANS